VRENAMIFEMVKFKFGFTRKDLESLPFGIDIPLREVIRKSSRKELTFFGKEKMKMVFILFYYCDLPL